MIHSLLLAALSLASTSPAPAPRIGLCAPSPKEWAGAKRAGFDYIEVGVRNIADMDDAAFAAAKATAKEVGLPMPVANLFVPGEMKIVGPDVDMGKLMAYATKALGRVAELGVKTVVFGSGGARKVPDGWSRDKAWQQLVTFGKRVAPEAAKRGITIAVEPLRREECNIINTAGEGLRYVQAVGHPNFKLMVDFYHLASEHEDARIIIDAAPHIRHFHIANPNGRLYPLGADEFDYGPFFRAVRRIGYTGGISVEGKATKFDEDAPRAITFLRAAAAGASK